MPSDVTQFENARQIAEGIRLWLDRIHDAEFVCEQAIKARQFLDDWEATRQGITEEQAGLQLARHELEQELADLRRQKQAMVDEIVDEGSRALHARQAELKEGLASLEQDKLHAADLFERDVKERTQRVAELLAEEDRLQKLCAKHRAQLGKIRAEVLRAMDAEEEG